MQILHPFDGPVRAYEDELSDPDRYRPACCPQCSSDQPLVAHGFYERRFEDAGFDARIWGRRYLCKSCKRTTSLLPAFALPYLRSGVTVIARFLVTRLLHGQPLRQALGPNAPFQRGQHWVRRFRARAAALSMALAPVTPATPVVPAAEPPPTMDFVRRAIERLNEITWIPAHRFLLSCLRSTYSAGRPRSLRTASAARFSPPPRPPDPEHRVLVWPGWDFDLTLVFVRHTYS